MSTKVEVRVEGPTATLTFAGEGKANVLSSATLRELEQRIEELTAQREVRVWVLTGAGTTFLAGADIKELSELPDAAAAREISRLGRRVAARLAAVEAVTVAAVNGAALGGGCELALACDLRLASEKAKFGLPETTLGVIPGWGGTERLGRVIGPARAAEMILTGRILSAREATEYGLAGRVVPREEFAATVNELVAGLLAVGPTALLAAKKALREGAAGGPVTEAETATEVEQFGRCFAEGEAREGLRAFLEKRNPAWRVQG